MIRSFFSRAARARFVATVRHEGLPAALELLREQGETAWTMGEIVPRRDAPVEWS